VLHLGIKRKFRVPTLFASMIVVFILLYVLAEFFSGDALTFLIGSLALVISWFLFDYICKSSIADSYTALNKMSEVQTDPLYVAVGLWMVCDVLLVIWTTLVVISVWKAAMTAKDAGYAMLLAFSFSSYLVLRSVKK
jgi:hypothetical protein